MVATMTERNDPPGWPNHGSQGGVAEGLAVLRAALAPLAAIADEYDENALDEARPDWIANGAGKFDLDVELYSGRGGKCLITLRHAMQARLVLTGKPFSGAPAPEHAAEVFRALYLGGPQWHELSEAKRAEYSAKVKEMGL